MALDAKHADAVGNAFAVDGTYSIDSFGQVANVGLMMMYHNGGQRITRQTFNEDAVGVSLRGKLEGGAIVREERIRGYEGAWLRGCEITFRA